MKTGGIGSTALAAALAGALALTGAGVVGAQDYPPRKPGFDTSGPNLWFEIPGQPAGQGVAFGSQPLVTDLGAGLGWTTGYRSIVFANRAKRVYVVRKAAAGTTWEVAPGWPQTLPTYAYSSPAAADLNADSEPDIVIGYGYVNTIGACAECGHGGIRAFRRTGAQLWDRQILDVQPGPVGEGYFDPVVTAPAIADIDGDGTPEVAFGGLDHNLYVVNGGDGTNQTGWPRDMQDTIFSTPVLFDLDGDGKREVIVGIDRYLSNGGQLAVLKHDGTVFPGFPKSIDQVVASSPAVGDIDGDGQPEIVHGTGTFYTDANNGAGGPPAQRVYAWNCDGSPQWGTVGSPGLAIPGGGQVTTSPALANLDGDPELEAIFTIIAGYQLHKLWAVNGNGTNVFAPVDIRDFDNVSFGAGDPVVANVLGTSDPEILVATNGEVVVFSKDGVLLTDTNAFTGGEPDGKLSYKTSVGGVAGAVVTDLETDGAGNLIEVIAISATPYDGNPDLGRTSTTVHVWNPGAGTSTPPWGMFHQDERRLGVAPGTPNCFDENCLPPTTPTDFTPITPCRAFDSRGPSNTLPPFQNNETRNIALRTECPGVPLGAVAVAINVTVTQSTRAGSVALHMGDCTQASLATIPFSAGQTRANNAVMPLSLDGNCELTAKALLGGTGSVHVIVDVNGYFAPVVP